MSQHDKKNPKFTPSADNLAKQEFAKETNINHIAARARQTGVYGSPSPNARKPVYGDFTSIDFQEMQNRIAEIEQNFMSLPPKTRVFFKNDPYQLIRFCENPDNAEKARKMGLIPPAPAEEGPFEDDEPTTVPDPKKKPGQAPSGSVDEFIEKTKKPKPKEPDGD